MDNFTIIADMVREAERHADDLSHDRVRATEYYRGEMKDTPADTGRSSVVRRDVRANIKKVLPSIARTLLNSDEMVKFMPIGAGDEDGAQQASDYINYVILPESRGKQTIYDAVHDALLLRNGILKWWWDESQQVKISRHTGLPDDAFAELVADDDVEVLEHSEAVEMIEAEGQQMPVTLHDVKIRRTFTDRCVRCAAVPRERFLIHPDAVTLEDSILVGEMTTMRRSDLIRMGYDRELVDNLPLAEDEDYEESARRDFVSDNHEAQRANDMVDYYDLYIRVDMDGDGIAELRHMCFAGGLKEKNLLIDEECDEVQFADLAVMRQPHQWEGISLADDLMDIQRAGTVLLRQTLDNIYWQNNPQPVIDEKAIVNPEAVFNPEFGLPIRVRQGVDVRAAMGFNTIPFVARDSFGMLEYLDAEATDRTGVSDASSGLAPDALQNMTAKASAMIEQAGIGQTEFMVKTVADGLRRFFRGLLRLTIRHQDVPRTVRLRDEWVTFDPRDWNADMDVTVNTGLGAGTRERDMMVMQNVMALQEKMLTGFGPDNPFVKPDNVYNALSKMVESAGLKTPSLYFTEPDPQEVEAKLEAMRNRPNPEQMKLQAQMQLEQAKMQAQMQLEQAKMEASRDKERAQMEADLAVKQAEINANTQAEAERMQADRAKQDRQLSWEREKFHMQQRLELTKLGLTQNANGEVVNPDAEAMREMLRQAQAMLLSVGQQIERANRPKRIIRDEMGEIVGVGDDERQMMVVRDDGGEIVGLQ